MPYDQKREELYQNLVGRTKFNLKLLVGETAELNDISYSILNAVAMSMAAEWERQNLLEKP